jgi:phosphoribosyl 1,2-cyclic phosphate phosphodiesterase
MTYPYKYPNIEKIIKYKKEGLILKIKYLGTAAAEGYPGIFCNCDYCQAAKNLGGKNIRTRSQCIVDDHLLIDFPADSYTHMLQHHIDLPNIHSILITHTHQDHLYLEDLGLRCDGFSHIINGTLTLYGNNSLKTKFHQLYNQNPTDTHLLGKLDCIELAEFIPVPIENYIITPLLANHDKSEKCYIYLLEKDNRTLLYGNDTGWFSEATWHYLSGKKIDCLSLDCTHMKYKEGSNHMGFPDILQLIKQLETLHCIKPDTKMILTHFSHNGHLLHTEMEALANPHGIQIAYDGLEVVF